MHEVIDILKTPHTSESLRVCPESLHRQKVENN